MGGGVPTPQPTPLASITPIPQPTPQSALPEDDAPTPAPAHEQCTCARSTPWDGDFVQFASGNDFCNQNFGGSGPYVSAGGGSAGSGGWSGSEPCSSGQYTFSSDAGWRSRSLRPKQLRRPRTEPLPMPSSVAENRTVSALAASLSASHSLSK